MDPLHRMARRLQREMAIRLDEDEALWVDLEVAGYILTHPDFVPSIQTELGRICKNAMNGT